MKRAPVQLKRTFTLLLLATEAREVSDKAEP